MRTELTGLPRRLWVTPQGDAHLLFSKEGKEGQEQELEADKLLGEGTFKHAEDAVNIETGEVLATLSATISGQEQFFSLYNEIRHLMQLKGTKGIIELKAAIAYVSKKGKIKFRLLQKKGNEGELTSSNYWTSKAVDHNFDLARQIVSSLNEVHKKGLIHGDLKPENILLHWLHNKRLVSILSDFGAAYRDKKITSLKEDSFEIKMLSNDSNRNQEELKAFLSNKQAIDAFLDDKSRHSTTKLFASREYLEGLRKLSNEKLGVWEWYASPQTVTQKHDIWAVGLILLQLYYPHLRNLKRFQRTTDYFLKCSQLQINKVINNWVSDDNMAAIIKMALTIDPAKRAAAQQLLDKLNSFSK